MAHNTKMSDPFVPSTKDVKLANDASRILATHSNKRKELHIELRDGTKQVEHMVLPPSVVRMVQQILTEMAQGNAITVMPMNAELTTQEAADFLGVSRPFLVKQLESGIIDYRKVGTHRRVSVKKLLEYKYATDYARQKTLDELTAEAQRLGLGY